MSIGEPGDRYEQEADRVASQVVQRINAPASAGRSVQRQEKAEKDIQAKPEITSLQRRSKPEEELQAKLTLQRREAIAGGETSTDLESTINRARGSGQPLEAGLQQSMGQAMGADFSRVRVHTDAQSDQLNQSIQAKAFTTGQDVFFRHGRYQPGSRGGQELIAHELTHVVQQNGGAVQRSPLPPEQLSQHPATENPSASEGDHVIQVGVPPQAPQRILGGSSLIIQRATSITLVGEESVSPVAQINGVVHTRTAVSDQSRKAAQAKDWLTVPVGVVCNHSVSYDNLLGVLMDYGRRETVVDYVGLLTQLYFLFYTLNPPTNYFQTINHLGKGTNVDRNDLTNTLNYLLYKICDSPLNLFFWPTKTNTEPDFPTDISAGSLPTRWVAVTGLDLTGASRRSDLNQFRVELEKTIGL
ncbi:eCIS core domain-containing protein [Nostoc sp.]|uniref:eCIS core domain-containing protein n=1 Tax=Nostoc sp. TaxID=1180 RepID=UPI002FF92DC3